MLVLVSQCLLLFELEACVEQRDRQTGGLLEWLHNKQRFQSSAVKYSIYAVVRHHFWPITKL